jgi:4-amino-4-deoxy-L-arabinose transferase-like glycosyltransferase
MKTVPNFAASTYLALILVIGCAAVARGWFLVACADGGWLGAGLQVQGDFPRPPLAEGTRFRGRPVPTELDNLAANVAGRGEFSGRAPLAEQEEPTAHVAPGYPWLLGTIAEWKEDETLIRLVPARPADAKEFDATDWIMRWLQCVLGSLTAALYFLFARRAFRSTAVAIIAGLLTAFYPFWIINTAELNDGVLAGFLLGACLYFGTRAGQTGGPISGLLFGAALAGLCMVRAAMLPFALAGALWFLWRCRRFGLGWLAATLCLVGFVNGLAPWTLRNYRLYERAVPIASTTFYHLWMGNNSAATGSVQDEQTVRSALEPARVQELTAEPNQARRYDELAHDLGEDVQRDVERTLTLRIRAGLAFFFGADWFKHSKFASDRPGADVAELPAEVKEWANTALSAALLASFTLAILGWRWSYGAYVEGRLLAVAALWIPLPYILSHAEALSGPRLPFDGVLLSYAAFALAQLLPGSLRNPEVPIKSGKKKG